MIHLKIIFKEQCNIYIRRKHQKAWKEDSYFKNKMQDENLLKYALRAINE